MNRIALRPILAAGAVLVAFGVALAGARTTRPAHAADNITAAQVRTAYVAAGQRVADPVVSANGVTSLAVSDVSAAPGERPVLRVLIYPDIRAATAGRRQAIAEDVATRGQAATEDLDRGPQLLTGYGLSAWRLSIALVQAAPADDVGAWPVEMDCAPMPSPQLTVVPRTVVDPRYIATLDALLQLSEVV
jgi:hypothetical protein